MPDKTYEKLYEFQFYQDLPGFLLMKFVPKENLTLEDIEKIKSKLQKKLGIDVEIKLERAKTITRAKNGKYKLMIQNIL